MKFFILCFLILSSFSLMASYIDSVDIPTEDRNYLNQEEDENGYGCTDWNIVSAGRSVENSHGEWVDTPPVRKCIEYCRSPRSGEINTVSCNYRITFDSMGFEGSICTGLAETAQAATAEARSICNYKARQYIRDNEHTDGKINIVCRPPVICFDIFYPPLQKQAQ